MYRWGREQEVESSGDLPRCATQSCRKSILVPMRYVAVCRNGHVSDVDWFKWAHSDPKTRSEGSCDARHQQLKFTTQSHMGSSLEALRIECERCGAYRSLQDLSQSNALARAGQKCAGRRPWQRRQQEEVNCDAPLKALLRSQTAVHFSDLKSALDVTTGRARRDQAFDDTFTEVVRNPEDFQASANQVTMSRALIGSRSRLAEGSAAKSRLKSSGLRWPNTILSRLSLVRVVWVELPMKLKTCCLMNGPHSPHRQRTGLHPPN